MQVNYINSAQVKALSPLRKEDAKMDIWVSIETKRIPISVRKKSIFDKFREKRLFPIIKIVRAIGDDEEIINVCIATMETGKNGRNYLIARQIEIIRERPLNVEPERNFLIPFWMN